MNIGHWVARTVAPRAAMIAVAGVFAVSGQALAAPTELKIGFYQPEAHIFVKVARDVLPELEKKTQGRYKFGLYPSEVLGKAAEQIDMTNRGLVFANLICTCYYPGTFPLFNIETVPIWSGVEGVKAAYEGGLGKLYEEYLHSKGMTNVGYHGVATYVVRSLGMKKTPVRVPGDLKGQKIRTLGLEQIFATTNGASVITIPAPDMYEALNRNMIGGVIATETNWIQWKLQEVLGSITFLDMTASPMSLIYSISDMNKIPEADRKLVLEVLTNYKDTLAAAVDKDVTDSRTWLKTKWKGEAIFLTPEQKRAMSKSAEAAATKVYLEKTEDFGRKAIAIVKKYNQ